ncbi:MAG: BlaI/MecI/CopY family transcriptional regulator [Planctomycetes bacterium]|nr:BlaI/MecI/CopY family transcriptional regulator [Planctomycetota bacterium]
MAQRKPAKSDLSPLEQTILDIVWRRKTARADDVREALRPEHDLTDSTVRTLLRRIEGKGYLEHTTEGRTFVYRSPVKPSEMANQAVQQVVDRFCQGSLSSLLIGMADDRMITADELRTLAAEIERAEKKSHRPG